MEILIVLLAKNNKIVMDSGKELQKTETALECFISHRDNYKQIIYICSSVTRQFLISTIYIK